MEESASVMMAFTERNDETQAVPDVERGGVHEGSAAVTWRQHAATLAEVDKATLRLVALCTSRNMSDAATRLGMAPVSPSRWIGRRNRRGGGR